MTDAMCAVEIGWMPKKFGGLCENVVREKRGTLGIKNEKLSRQHLGRPEPEIESGEA